LVYTAFNGNIDSGMHVDHIDGDKVNNRLDNLRLCTPSENYRNTKGRSSTGSKGVYRQSTGKYYAVVTLPARDTKDMAEVDRLIALQMLSAHSQFEALKFHKEIDVER
jgi:hypothetical protein